MTNPRPTSRPATGAPLRRRAVLGATAAITALFLAACGGGSDTKADGGQASGTNAEALQIYSSQHQNLTEAWAKAFTAKTGIETEIRAGKDSSMGHQIVEEGKAGNADVFLTENSPAMTVVQRAGLLAPVDDATKAQIPDGLQPSSGDWIPVAARSTVLVYNTKEITPDELPKSMMDLADPAWKGRWGGAPGGADFQAIVSGMVATQGQDATQQWLIALKNNAQIYQNNIATMKAVNAGEVPVGVMYHYYWYRDQAGDKAGSENTKLHYFGNGDAGAFVSLSAGGVLTNAKHPDQAQQFLAFITSPEGQQAIADSKSMEYAVATGAASDPALPPLADLGAPTVDPSSLDSDEVIKMMTDAGIL